MSDATRLHVGVYNRFWTTAGGGEKFAGGIAQALRDDHDVELIGHGGTSIRELAQRLQLDLTGVRFREVEASPTAIEAASADFDVFVNASYGSVLRNRARHGLYVVHFPIVGAPPPVGWRRFALRAAGRLARLSGAELDAVSWTGGAYGAEPMGPLTHRWTDGDGVVQVHGDGSRRQRVTLVCSRLVGPDGEAVPVDVWCGVEGGTGGARLGGGRIAARRAPAGLPLQFLRLRLPRGASGPVRLHVRSATHVPAGPGSDHRLLGVSVVAVLSGSWWQQLLQLVHQPLTAAASDFAFLSTYGRVAANSAFTATWVRRLWAVDPVELAPPVRMQPTGEKAPVILHVGRFFPPHAGHSKRQLELVEAFGRLVADGRAEGWALHLVGGCDDEGRGYLDEVRAAVGALPVHVHPNATADELRDLYARASIYWHATGLGDDPDAHPERMEHFGISTVEAMSAAAVPVAIRAAGQLEVFDDGVEGVHFDDIDGLTSATAALIADPARRAALGEAARRRARRYDEAAFRTRLLDLLGELTG